MKLGLDAIAKIEASLGHPSSAYPTVHVAGTNGKGSVATKIAKSLELSGKKVGLFTSPHIACVTERIQINGQPIPLAELREFPNLTFFESITLAAFCYFAEQKVDIAVIEVGLGGRLDATNIITPILSIITSIGYDHMDFLGNSLEEIAREKAGIIKPGVPYILGPNVCYIEGEKVEVRGTYEEENCALAKRACEILGIKPLGLAAIPPCRFQKIGKVVLDCAHNRDGLKRALERIEGPFTAIAAFSKQKEQMLELLSCAEKVYLPHIEHERLLPGEGTFEEAFQDAYPKAQTLLVVGSVFMMETALKTVEKAKGSEWW